MGVPADLAGSLVVAALNETGRARGGGERLQKVLAELGVGSRRACEDLIRQGRVAINGRVVTELGTKVGPRDELALDGKPVSALPAKRYLVLHKPAGYVTTTADPGRRPTVLDLVPGGQRLYPVGRLDADSEGLLLITNDGELTFRLTHPRYGVDKEYRVLVSGRVDERALQQMREGVTLDGRRAAPAEVAVAERTIAGTWLRFVIHEGMKRQVRRMCEDVGLRVLRLARVAVGPLRLGDLPPGGLREVTAQELVKLRKAAGLRDDGNIVVAIDGPAGAGKSALAEELARRHGLVYLDTGAMYRAVTLLALRRGIDPQAEESVSELAESTDIEVGPPTKDDGRAFSVLLDGEDVTWELYSPQVDSVVSVVSAHRGVREALVRRQRQIAMRRPSVVVGRDIGTVVVPEAPVKVYLDASVEQRALRRQGQLRQRNIAMPLERVQAEIRRRDKLDSERAMSPLAAAPDAVTLTTDRITVAEEVAIVEELMRQKGFGEGQPR